MDPTRPGWLSRRPLRNRGFDYATYNDYFVTICVEGRRCILGDVRDDRVALSDAGWLVRRHWLELATRYPFVELDEFVVMPNHLHGILSLRSDRDRGVTIDLPVTEIVGQFKSLTMQGYGAGVRMHGWRPYDRRLWQRGFYDRVIRNERELDRYREYIQLNPIRWATDRLNPANGAR